jgi:hypothetical protein
VRVVVEIKITILAAFSILSLLVETFCKSNPFNIIAGTGFHFIQRISANVMGCSTHAGFHADCAFAARPVDLIFRPGFLNAHAILD